MLKLIKTIENLKKTEIKKVIDKRIKEFKSTRDDEQLFSELSYCVMTAGFRADKSIEIQKKIGDGFLYLPEKKLEEKLRESGYRYPNRAEYIVHNRKYIHELKNSSREWLIEKINKKKRIKGIDMKEASHFLRNTGHSDYAIIDFHIIDILAKYNVIEKPKTINKKNYIEIENVLKNIAEKSNLNLAELDLYLWYLETGKVLK